MRRTLLARIAIGAGVVLLATGIGAGAASAGKNPAPGEEFFLSMTCTGLGDVIIVNQGFAPHPGLRVVGATTVIVPRDGNTGRANGECTITGGGLAPDQIEPFEPPLFTIPVLIVPPGA
jgi:hypothetical protein